MNTCELRWVTRQTKCKISCNPDAVGAKMIDGYKNWEVLQYRSLDFESTETGKIWTDWQDVPIVGIEDA